MRFLVSAITGTALILGSTALAQAAPDRLEIFTPAARIMSLDGSPAEAADAGRQLADFETAAGPALAEEDQVLYSVLSDQIREMRRKSALPAVMCLAESNGDGTAQTLPTEVMERLVADNAQAGDDLFTLKQATACISSGDRIVDSETHSRALLITAGPMEDDMKGLMSGCGDFVGGFVRAAGDSDYDFYAVNDGDVARKLGCELAQ
jgi:hypothetical protein